jgi:pyrroline-5-carboxylate reductase
MTKATIAIIGAGNMGASLLGGLIANHYPADKIYIADLDTNKLTQLKKQFNVHTTTQNQEAVKQADVIILAVKPQIMSVATQEITAIVKEKKPLVISVAAGIRENTLQHWLGKNIPIVRCMPNTPALISCGASALFANQFVTPEQHQLAETILQSVSLIVWLKEEKLMDAVTALSGSGPAYFFLMMEAMQNAGEDLGLPAETARMLTLQTAFGAARMALESDRSVVELRQGVTSPGGTTEQALNVLEKGKLRELFQHALTAAKNRSEELADTFGKI